MTTLSLTLIYVLCLFISGVLLCYSTSTAIFCWSAHSLPRRLTSVLLCMANTAWTVWLIVQVMGGN